MSFKVAPKRSWRVAALIAAGLAFFLTQFVIVLHETKFGGGPHEHDGRICVLSLIGGGAKKIVPASVLALAVFFILGPLEQALAPSARAICAPSGNFARGPPRS